MQRPSRCCGSARNRQHASGPACRRLPTEVGRRAQPPCGVLDRPAPMAAAVNDSSVADREKNLVALSSVGAAVLLTSMKVVVGLATGSLGILSEAAHSGIDLIAALMTLWAVRASSKPPDSDHLYGHGKIENFSALFETGLLLATCVWIAYEAGKRLVFGGGHVEATPWSFVVMGISIAVDLSRSRALASVARR